MLNKDSQISLCIIAKNEEAFIHHCITSARPWVNEVIIVDTGSSDKTKEIAENLGALVWDFPWIDDFSAARNFSLEKATGDWILVMDCDEEIDTSTGQKLLEAVKSATYDAYYVKVKNLLPGDNGVSVYSIRLFRNLPQFRFQGQIHEQISKSILEYSEKKRIGHIALTLLHHGYNPQLVNINAKISRNLKLLEAQEKSGAIDGFHLYNVGVEYIRQGQFQKALEKFIESLKLTKTKTGYAPYLAYKTVSCLIELKRYRDALEQLANFQEIYPQYSDLWLAEALCHLRCGRYTQAKQAILKAQDLAVIKSFFPHEGTISGHKPEKVLKSIDPLILSEKLQCQLSVCILAVNGGSQIVPCIKSISEISSEILVITTGCPDKILAAVYQLGAKIIRVSNEKDPEKLKELALSKAGHNQVLLLWDYQVLDKEKLPLLIDHFNLAGGSPGENATGEPSPCRN